MKPFRIARILRRTSGEVAFDRCFFPLAALFILGVGMGIVAFTHLSSAPVQPHTEVEQLAPVVPDPVWPIWLAFSVGLVAAFFWLRALVSVVQVWRDPSARVLRFSAVGLLMLLAGVTVRLLLLPFS